MAAFEPSQYRTRTDFPEIHGVDEVGSIPRCHSTPTAVRWVRLAISPGEKPTANAGPPSYFGERRRREVSVIGNTLHLGAGREKTQNGEVFSRSGAGSE